MSIYDRGMQLVPVIDLKGGLVVRAFKGQRDAYRPILTPLSKSSAPKDVIEGLLRLYPFHTVYIADLDAIDGAGDNREAVVALMRSFPKLRFWLDEGARTEAEPSAWSRWSQVELVIGSESLSSASVLRRFADNSRILLSLDFRGDKFLGPPELLEAQQAWPKRVIVMTLSRVGAGEGPDLEALGAIKERAGERQIFAAGGIRNTQDLEELLSAGISGALIASALHNGGISTKDLEKFAEM
jgi:phosphoribosylformimino-5-aminoimidazole carboxamide ribotide isomerase